MLNGHPVGMKVTGLANADPWSEFVAAGPHQGGGKAAEHRGPHSYLSYPDFQRVFPEKKKMTQSPS